MQGEGMEGASVRDPAEPPPPVTLPTLAANYRALMAQAGDFETLTLPLYGRSGGSCETVCRVWFNDRGFPTAVKEYDDEIKEWVDVERWRVSDATIWEVMDA